MRDLNLLSLSRGRVVERHVVERLNEFLHGKVMFTRGIDSQGGMVSRRIGVGF